MLYLIAILLPPAAQLMCGKVIQAVLCVLLMLTLIGWPIAAVWALLVVGEHKADRRAERMVRVMEKGR